MCIRDSLDAGLVWAKAQAWRPDPAAERASDLAEDRLRPDVMERYDRLRAEGTDPVEVMRRVAPALTPRRCGPGSRAWPGPGGPGRAGRHPAGPGTPRSPVTGERPPPPSQTPPSGCPPRPDPALRGAGRIAR